MMQNILLILIVCVILVRANHGMDCYKAEQCDNFDIKYGKNCCPSIYSDDAVIVCDNDNFDGVCKYYSMFGEQCVNVENNDVASSVNTLGKCFRIYEHINCQGRSRPLLPGSRSHNSMAALHMNGIISSIGRCNSQDYYVGFVRLKRSSNSENDNGFANR